MSKESKAWFAVLKSLINEYPKVVVAGFLQGIIQGVRPFVAIYFTALLIDSVYAGKGVKVLIHLALLSGIITMILSLADSVCQRIFNRNMEFMYEHQIGPLSKKSMQMDYEYLEDAKVHTTTEEILGFYSRFGLIGIMLDCVYHFMDVFASLFCTVLIVVPKLIANSQNGSGFVGTIWCSCGFILVFVLLNMWHVHILNTYNEKNEVFHQERSKLHIRVKYYLDLYAKTESQKDIIMCGQKDTIEADIDKVDANAKDVMRRATRLIIERDVKSESIATISTILVFLFSAVYGYYGIISIGGVVSFAASIRRLADGLFVLSEQLGRFKYQSIYALKYQEFMNLNQRKYEGTIPMEKRRDNKFTVEFENVSFKYPGASNYVIKDLNLKFVVGEKLAIVGKNGSGKTTFIKLLCRLYDVTDGCIKVNGIDIRKYDYTEYCRLFGVVFQDFVVFDFPIGETLANSTVVDEVQAIDALTRAGLHDRLMKLSNGLNTYIGKGFDDSGVNFSGGEKQKLAIARAIYKDAPFVIMDEPTAALDPEAEAEVFEGFDKMVGKKTAIYISHRLASCKFCEDILVFDKGKVVQHGTHDELEKQDGLYRKLWNAQARYYA